MDFPAPNTPEPIYPGALVESLSESLQFRPPSIEEIDSLALSNEEVILRIPNSKEKDRFDDHRFGYQILRFTQGPYEGYGIRFCTSVPNGTSFKMVHSEDKKYADQSLEVLCNLITNPFYCVFKEGASEDTRKPSVLWRPICDTADFEFIQGEMVEKNWLLNEIGVYLDAAKKGSNFIVVENGVIMAQLTRYDRDWVQEIETEHARSKAATTIERFYEVSGNGASEVMVD